jgi:hypothetical protein
MKWLEPKVPSKVFCVNYHAFLNSVCPNFRCALPSLCCDDQSCPQPCLSSSRTCIDDPCDPRDLAGVVITDNQVRSEELRCDDEDCRNLCSEPSEEAEEDCCNINNSVQWTSADFQNEDPCLLEAYRPEAIHDCYPAEAGRREFFRPGDFISQGDLYGERR